MFTDPESNAPYIWTPDIEIYENANLKLSTELRKGLAHVNHTGEVYIDMNGHIDVSVNMILANFPYDTQNVTLTLTSWSYTDIYLKLRPHSLDGN